MLPKGPLLGLLLLISKLERLDGNLTNLDELCAAAGWGQYLAQEAASKQPGAFQLFPFQQAAPGSADRAAAAAADRQKQLEEQLAVAMQPGKTSGGTNRRKQLQQSRRNSQRSGQLKMP